MKRTKKMDPLVIRMKRPIWMVTIKPTTKYTSDPLRSILKRYMIRRTINADSGPVKLLFTAF